MSFLPLIESVLCPLVNHIACSSPKSGTTASPTIARARHLKALMPPLNFAVPRGLQPPPLSYGSIFYQWRSFRCLGLRLVAATFWISGLGMPIEGAFPSGGSLGSMGSSESLFPARNNAGRSDGERKAAERSG